MASAAAQLDDYENYVESHRPAHTLNPQNQLSCGAEFSRKGLLAINLFFLGLGATICGVGAFTINSDVATLTSKGVSIGIIALGGIIIFISFFGCCGAQWESRWMLGFYAIILTVLIIIQLVLGVLLLSDKGKASDLMESGWENASPSTRCDLQENFDCCGLRTFNDTLTPNLLCPDKCIPGSPPCLNKLKDKFEDNLVLLATLAIVFCLFEVFGVLFAVCLRAALWKIFQKQMAEEVAI